jgi:methylated-DNA-[protein]-cysteine S-methyltransferase
VPVKPPDSLSKGSFKTSQGWCAAVWTDKGLSALVIAQASKEKALQKIANYFPPLSYHFWNKPLSSVPLLFQKGTRKAQAGKKFKTVPVDLFFMTRFQQAVLSAATQIPWGETRTYGWVAAKAGSPRGFRAAGQALNRCPVSLLIPCHRVIANGSKLGGCGGDLNWKIRLLKLEKVSVQRASDGSYKVH